MLFYTQESNRPITRYFTRDSRRDIRKSLMNTEELIQRQNEDNIQFLAEGNSGICSFGWLEFDN